MFSLDSQILLIFSAFGALNGVLVAAYLALQTTRVLENRFLALMVLMLSVRIFKSVLFFFNPEISKAVLQLGLSACFLIGPFTYFFVYFHLQKDPRISVLHKCHLAGLLGVLVCVALFLPYGQYEQIWGRYLYKVINYTWLGYLLLSFWLARQILRTVIRPGTARHPRQIWLVSVLTGNLLVWLAYYTSHYTSYIVGALSFSFILMLMVLLIMLRKQASPDIVKYAHKKIAEDESGILLARLDELMSQQRLYENPNLTMPQLAKKMAMPVPKFSQLLNDNLKKSFPQFVNEYRVKAAKSLLLEKDNLTMEVISELCGFNSQSTFYTAFKKITLMTPAKFRSQFFQQNTSNL